MTKTSNVKLGSLLGLWRTRNGQFVSLDKVAGDIYSGFIMREDGKRVPGIIRYTTPNHITDNGLDLMLRKRGDEKNVEDFIWPKTH